MNRLSLLVIFGLICVSFLFSGCSGAKWILCTSNGIVTYNRATGQFEMVWEYAAQPGTIHHDTVYVNESLSLDSVGER